jgi:two-component system sensor histidine kinase NblS
VVSRGFSVLKNNYFSSENRILLLVIAAISFSFLLVAYVININYHNALNDNYDRFANMITQVVSVGGTERLQSPNGEFHIRTFTDSMVQSSEDIAGIEFYGPDRQLIYKNIKPLSSADLKNTTDYVAPLKTVAHDGAEPKVIGSVHVKLTGQTLKDIKNATQSIILWMFLSAWFISVFAVSLNTYILNKHLRTFVRGVQRLSTGDFGYKILEHDLWGELVTLAESFNDMSMRLRAYEDQNLETITFERNKLKAILLSIADGVIVCDMQGKVVIINDAACGMLGFKSGDWAINTNLKDYVTEENERCFEPMIVDFEKQSQDKSAQLPQLLTHKLELPGKTLKVMLSPIQDVESNLLGYVLILHDVTKEAEVDKMKTSFISNVSHELRTPVTTIKSYVDTIYNHGKDLDPETYAEFIETINVETDRLKKLVNDILDFSRLEEGAVVLERELADITPVINLTVQSVKVLADQKKITLSTAIESGLPKAFINPDSIERVLRNLLSNAIKYTDENGRIKVRAEVTELGDALEVSVQDSGIGIPEEHLPYIFDRFYRVENKVHTVKGTGLGLHLVKIAIEKHHGGEVFVKSEVGSGSTFGFRIPLGEPDTGLPFASEKSGAQV